MNASVLLLHLPRLLGQCGNPKVAELDKKSALLETCTQEDVLAYGVVNSTSFVKVGTVYSDLVVLGLVLGKPILFEIFTCTEPTVNIPVDRAAWFSLLDHLLNRLATSYQLSASTRHLGEVQNKFSTRPPR